MSDRMHNQFISTVVLMALLSLAAAPAGVGAADPPVLTDTTSDAALNEPFALALAQAAPDMEPEAPPVRRGTPERPFAEGSWTFQIYGSGVTMDEDHGYISTAHVGVGYHLDDYFSINLEGIGGWVDSKVDDDGGVGGADLLLRHHFAHDEDDRWTIYFDGGAGAQQATTDFPSDSHFNFRLLTGLGGTLQLKENLRLMGGARYMHVSNAGTTNGNDGGDWAQFYLGAMLTF